MALPASDRSGFQPKGHGPIIDQAHPHVGAKAPGRDLGMASPGRRQEQIEEAATLIRWRGGGEAGAGPLAGIRRQGELGDQQQAPAQVPQAQVHAAPGVGKDPIAQQAFEESPGPAGVIPLLHPDQYQQPLTNGPHRLVGDLDPRLGHALQ